MISIYKMEVAKNRNIAKPKEKCEEDNVVNIDM